MKLLVFHIDSYQLPQQIGITDTENSRSKISNSNFRKFYEKHCASNYGSVSYKRALELTKNGQDFFKDLRNYAKENTSKPEITSSK